MQSFFIRSIIRLMKKKTIKLNSLQRRTLALFQVLARSPESSVLDDDTGEVTISYLPRPHGDHVHIGDVVVSAQDASGFANEAVWRALDRKGLITSQFPLQAILTRQGLAFETGFGNHFE